MTFVKKQNAGLLKSARSWGALGLLLALAVVTVGYGPQDVSLGQETRQLQPPNPFRVGRSFAYSATYLAQTGTPPRVLTVDSDSGSASYEVTEVKENTATFRVTNTFSQLVAGRSTAVPTEPVLYRVNTSGLVLETNANTADPTARGTAFQDVAALNLGFELFAFNLQAGQKLRIGIDEYTVGPKPVEITIGRVRYTVWEARREFSDAALRGTVTYQYNTAGGVLVQHVATLEFRNERGRAEFGANRISINMTIQESAPSLYGGMAMDTRSMSETCAELGGLWAGDHVPSGTSSGTARCFARHLGMAWLKIAAFVTCSVPCLSLTGGTAIFACLKVCAALFPLQAVIEASQDCKWPKILY